MKDSKDSEPPTLTTNLTFDWTEGTSCREVIAWASTTSTVAAVSLGFMACLSLSILIASPQSEPAPYQEEETYRSLQGRTMINTGMDRVEWKGLYFWTASTS